MKLFTVARDNMLYNATAEYNDGIVVVKKGSKINRNNAPGFHPKKLIADLRSDETLFYEGCYLSKDLTFKSLSAAATFVTGRIANGNIVWKTENNKYVKYSLEK